jgi:tRNA(fMet)-specific endonuclease VapC
VIILDSDILSIIQRRAGDDYLRLQARLDGFPAEEVVVTIVSFEEQTRGWLAYIARATTVDKQIAAYAKLHELLRDFYTRPVLDFDAVAGTEYQRLIKLKIRIGTMDLKIASIALATRATIYTRNTVDFSKVPGLLVEDPTAR